MLASRINQRLGRQGVALPLALFGLVAVTVLVTGALLSSSTQAAITGAQQTASQRLYQADGILEHLIYARAAIVDSTVAARRQPLQPMRKDTTVNGRTFSVSIAQMGQWDVANFTGNRTRRFEKFSLAATPTGGGRTVGAMYTVYREWLPVDVNINQAGSIGSDAIKAPGKSSVISGRDSSRCSTGDVTAVLLANDVGGAGSGNSDLRDNVEGAIDTANVSKANFASFLFGTGMTPTLLAGMADITFTGSEASGTITGNPFDMAVNSKVRWGCPIGLAGITEANAATKCRSIQDTAYYPIIAVRPAANGSVVLSGYGQGIVIVLGDATLRNFDFKGLVILAGDIGKINGTSNIYGSLVALSDAGLEFEDGNADDFDINGQSLVKYNRCNMINVTEAFTGAGANRAAQHFDGSTLSWFEVVR